MKTKLDNKIAGLQNVERQLITDREHNHFQVVTIAWRGDSFYYTVTLHFDIKPDTGKVWIQVNWTEDDVAQMLIDRGVAKEDIVLGWIFPAMRKFYGDALVY